MSLTLGIILSILTIVSFSILLLFVYNNWKLKEQNKYYSDLFYQLEDLYTNERGYYDYVACINDENYVARIHIIEKERFLNGYSDIKLLRVEVLSGFEPEKYNYIKSIVEKIFSSVIETSKITWLESDNMLQKVREKKMKSILEKHDLKNTKT